MSRSNPLFRSPFYSHPSPTPLPPSPPKRNLINIPVHFISSVDRHSAATTIQRAFRGFLVRKKMNTVRQIEAEVNAIVRRIESEEGIDLILRDEKERLKVNEMLMRLLFRLDSVRGVRDYRRRVIRRVISLQESVDAMATVRSNDEVETLEDQRSELNVTELMEEIPQPEVVETLEDKKVGVEEAGTLETEDQSLKLNFAESMEEMPQSEEVKTIVEDLASRRLHHQTLEEDEDTITDEVIKTQQDEELITGTDEVKTLENENLSDPMEISAGWELIGEGVSTLEEEESAEKPKACTKTEVSGLVIESKSREKDVMERMVAENERLRGLVLELCERSVQQCRVMGGLAERVEQLEKMVEKMERKRKKNKRKCENQTIDKKSIRDLL